MPGALQGVKVLDLTRFAAGPICTCLLGELGAEIIKVEEPGRGEAQRIIPPILGGVGYTFHIVNHNKKSLTLNLRHEKGREVLKQLVPKVDVLVENFSPGVMDRLGLSYDELRQLNPSLIYTSVSGFGQTGPYRSKPSYDLVIQAMSGMMSLTGFPDKPPVRTGPAVVDIITPLYTTIAILAALYYRKVTGKGQRIDISMFDAAWATIALEFLPHLIVYGKAITRMGNRHPNVVPYNCYPTADGHIVIATANDEQWQALAEAMGRPELKDDPRLATLSERVKNVELVDSIVEEWTREKPTADVMARLEAARVPAAPVVTIDKLIDDPQLRERNMIQEIEFDGLKVTIPGSVLKLSETPGQILTPGPKLGEHTEEILTSLLDYPPEEIKSLKAQGVI